MQAEWLARELTIWMAEGRKQTRRHITRCHELRLSKFWREINSEIKYTLICKFIVCHKCGELEYFPPFTFTNKFIERCQSRIKYERKMESLMGMFRGIFVQKFSKFVRLDELWTLAIKKYCSGWVSRLWWARTMAWMEILKNSSGFLAFWLFGGVRHGDCVFHGF